MPPKIASRSSRRNKDSDDEEVDENIEEGSELTEEMEVDTFVEDVSEKNEPVIDTEKSDSIPKSPENPPVDDNMVSTKNMQEEDKEQTEGEPPSKKSKVAEEALKKIEAEKQRKEKEKKEAEEKAINDRRKDLDKFWKTVKDDPSDFTGWTQLLQFVDSKNDLEAGREAYEGFLKRYPYCYGYWKKFADFEKRNGTAERVMEVSDQVLS